MNNIFLPQQLIKRINFKYKEEMSSTNKLLNSQAFYRNVIFLYFNFIKGLLTGP